MAPVSRSLIESSLSKKGFELANNDHHNYTFFYNGKKTQIRTKISHGSGYKDYSDSLLKCMSHQLKLSKAQLLDLINCPMTQEKYISILKEQKIISDTD